MGWITKPLGEVCTFQGGSQPPKSTFVYELKEGYVRLIQIRDYKSDKHIVYIPKELAKRHCNRDEVMIGRYGPPIFQILRGIDGAYNVALMKAIPDESVLDRGFLFLFLKSPEIQKYVIGSSSRAAGQSGLNKATLEPFPISFPKSIEEQKLIVAILDEAFEGIDAAIANTQKNLTNARELFENILTKILANPKEGWETILLNDICDLYQGLAINKGTKHLLVEKSSLPLLRIKDLRNGTEEQYVAEVGFPKNAEIFKEDLIYTRTGQIGLVFRGRRGVLHNNSFKIVARERMNRDYFFWLLQEPSFKTKIIELSSRAAQPDITHKIFKAQKILLPPMTYQLNAINRIERAFSDTQHLEEIYQQKLDSLNELKQSLLQKAFSGELTADSDQVLKEAVG